MLVLSRRKNEQIVIGDNIFVTLVQIRRGHVRLGIEAPRNVPVHRKEIYDALRNEQALQGRGHVAEGVVGSQSE